MDFPIAQAIWYSSDSDRMQINMLREAIDATPKTRWEPRLPAAHKDLRWLAERAFNLADKRNNAVHAPCIVQFGKNGAVVVSDPFSGHARAKRLMGATLEDEFEYCIERAMHLEAFTRAAIICLRDEHGAWPDRPLLPEKKQKKDPIK
jgi:hypothetical protein